MVNNLDIKKLIIESTKGGGFSDRDEKKINGTYLFFSFDLVNSTLFKSLNKEWSNAILDFYRIVKDEITKKIAIQEWKKAGDEILFYFPVRNLEVVKSSPKITFDVLKKSIQKLHDVYGAYKNILSIKASLWIAYMSEDTPDDSLYSSSNIIIKTPDIDRYILDFLGPDIDIGFRISKYISQSKVVVDAKLALLLFQLESDVSRNLRIVSYEILKGVWNERKYPIVWYFEDWGSKNDMFIYDEETNSNIVKKNQRN